MCKTSKSKEDLVFGWAGVMTDKLRKRKKG